jgi:hypothetical protein
MIYLTYEEIINFPRNILNIIYEVAQNNYPYDCCLGASSSFGPILSDQSKHVIKFVAADMLATNEIISRLDQFFTDNGSINIYVLPGYLYPSEGQAIPGTWLLV